MFVMAGMDDETALEALRMAAYKLPIATNAVRRSDPITGEEVS